MSRYDFQKIKTRISASSSRVFGVERNYFEEQEKTKFLFYYPNI
jgi:hypothetical protein